MIDTCKFYVMMTARVHEALMRKRSENSSRTPVYGNYFYVPLNYGLPKLRINFDARTKTMWLETSLPKVVQGHNVFGSNALQGLCLAVVAHIYAQLGVEFSEEEKKLIVEERIRIGRLDITCSFRFGSRHMVDAALECIYDHVRSQGRPWSAYGRSTVESVYNQMHSTRTSDKYYSKGRELGAKTGGIPLAVPGQERMQKMARRLLRYEVTYRGKELKERGLNYADQWDRTRVKNELMKRISKFKFHGEIRSSAEITSPPGLNPACQTFLDIWQCGVNLNEYRRYATLNRARTILLENHQIDIYRQPGSGEMVSLMELLDPQRAYYTAPRSLVKAGAIFTGRG